LAQNVTINDCYYLELLWDYFLLDVSCYPRIMSVF
jgi:hypothetical protein